jgi:hypothetical protein
LFNRVPFNRLPFNRPFSVELTLSATLEGEGEVIASLIMDLNLYANLDGIGQLIGEIIRDVEMAFDLHGIGEMDVTIMRERNMKSTLQGEGVLNGDLKQFRVESITIEVPFKQGDKIVIDSGKLTVRKNGVLIGYDGDFFNLNPGENTITYKDTESNRSVLCRITYRDRFI